MLPNTTRAVRGSCCGEMSWATMGDVCLSLAWAAAASMLFLGAAVDGYSKRMAVPAGVQPLAVPWYSVVDQR